MQDSAGKRRQASSSASQLIRSIVQCSAEQHRRADHSEGKRDDVCVDSEQRDCWPGRITALNRGPLRSRTVWCLSGLRSPCEGRLRMSVALEERFSNGRRNSVGCLAGLAPLETRERSPLLTVARSCRFRTHSF